MQTRQKYEIARKASGSFFVGISAGGIFFSLLGYLVAIPSYVALPISGFIGVVACAYTARHTYKLIISEGAKQQEQQRELAEARAERSKLVEAIQNTQRFVRRLTAKLHRLNSDPQELHSMQNELVSLDNSTSVILRNINSDQKAGDVLLPSAVHIDAKEEEENSPTILFIDPKDNTLKQKPDDELAKDLFLDQVNEILERRPSPV